ncbi:DUF4184 family protein [Mucilaginibacter sp. CSA2-8R]|uniref:DUF4184 family protein n=1 Tax=Mucilaginibacter sp. CSA2-8R TaxID=3141542 RepID=UPI00315D8339
MPFTFAHPAIVLPLIKISRRWLSLTALVVGSMTPDFDYFLRLRVKSVYSYTLAGLLWFDLPLGVLLTVLYLVCVKGKLLSALPQYLYRDYDGRSRDTPLTVLSVEYVAVICYSVLLGAASHLFWDAFTHPHGYFVDHILWLNKTIAIGNFKIQYYKLLQHASTAVGLSIIAAIIANCPKLTARIDKSFRINFWKTVALVVFFFVVIRFLLSFNHLSFGDFVLTIMSASFVGIFLSAVTNRVKYRGARSLLSPLLTDGQFILSRADYATGIVLDENLNWAVDDKQNVYTVYNDVDQAIEAARNIANYRGDIECYVHDSQMRPVYFIRKDEIKDLRQ